MPCNTDYMNPNSWEKELSKVACLLDELAGRKWDYADWTGNHPRVYNKAISKAEADKMVAELCSRLQYMDVTQCSLEMQMWWRDHQKADKERAEKELKEAMEDFEREEALAKLTDYEKGLLGLISRRY